MTNQTTATVVLTESQKGQAEKLLNLTLNASAHLAPSASMATTSRRSP